MCWNRNALLLALGVALAAPSGVAAQGKGPKKYAVSNDRALVVTKDVLVKQGYEVFRIEDKGPDRIIYYRRGNMGRGKGKGPPLKLIIRRVDDRIVFVDTPSAIMIDIDVKLKL